MLGDMTVNVVNLIRQKSINVAKITLQKQIEIFLFNDKMDFWSL